MSDERLRILMVHDQSATSHVTAPSLPDLEENYARFEMIWANCLAAAQDQLAHHTFDAVVLDLGLPDGDKSNTVRTIRATCPDLPLVVLTGNEGDVIRAQPLAGRPLEHKLRHDTTNPVLRRTILHAIQRHRTATGNRNLLADLNNAKKLLETKNRKLAEQYRTAHQFVDNVSHEFRTPLTVIKEFASIIRDGLAGPVNAEQLEYLGVINDRIEDLSAMVDDMLDISKVEAGMLHIARRKCTVDQVVDRVQLALLHRAAANKIELEVDVPPGLPLIFCDSEKIGRVITNLVINAFKFTPEGGRVAIRAAHEQGADDVQISVIDNGRGIAPENLQIIFDRFRQVDGPSRTGCKGFGLGLGIAREIVAAHMGAISVESQEGKGSTFTFLNPLADPRIVLRRYLARRRSLTVDAPGHIALVTAAAPPGVDSEVLDHLDHFLQGQVRLTDVSIQDSPSTWVLVAAVHESEAAQILPRIDDAWAAWSRNSIESDPDKLSIRLCGVWPVEQADPALLDAYRHATALLEAGHD